MSVARGFGLNGKSIYSNITKPCEVNLQFTVKATDSAGLGIVSLKSNGYVNNVFMHTSATPGTNNGLLNPNPAVGGVVIQLKQNLNVFLRAAWSIISKNSGSDVAINSTSLTVGVLYTITTLGTSTAADWTAIGVPAGVAAAVGVSFVAIKTGNGSGTGKVQLPVVSGIHSFEVVGNPNVGINTSIAANSGQFILGNFLGPTSSSVTTIIPVAPADGSIVMMKLYFDGSSATIDGL